MAKESEEHEIPAARPSGGSRLPKPRMLDRRRVLWVSFLAVFAPLLVLLALQYRWLADLEQASAIARRATLENTLGTITKEIRFFYWNAAERALNVPAAIFEPRYVHKIGKFFKKKGVEGAARFFVVNFIAETKDQRLLLYDPATGVMAPPTEVAGELTPEVRAIYAAVAPWSILHNRGGAIDKSALILEERDPDHRMILNPITDEASGLVGLAGMIVDQDHFRREILPQAIHDSLSAFSGEDAVVVTVRDAEGRQVLTTGPAGSGDGDDISRGFSFLFTDWKIALRGRDSTPAEWARANFAFNVTLSLASGVLLLGGILLVLRTTAREMRLSAMKNDFVSNVSHELRTPLASIRVFAELLRGGRVGSSEKVREYGEYIETESRRLTRLINNILDFSKIESGHKVYERASADLEEIVSSVMESFEVRLRKSGFEIDFERPATPLPSLLVDRDAIRQALSNLLDNAVKYSDGSRSIRVTLGREGDRAVVAVADHGIGISRREQGKIFERFHRVGTGLVHDVRGSGLGLSIVQHVVAAHGGRVTVESEPGRGSTFALHLPIGEAPESAGEQPPASAEESQLPLQQSG